MSADRVAERSCIVCGHDMTNMPAPYYEDGMVTIYHGDCRDWLPLLCADVVLTDPPYGIGLDYEGHKDDWRPGVDVWELVRTTGAASLHFTSSNRHIPHWLDDVRAAGFDYLHTSVYWNRGRAGGNWNGQFAYAWEPILSFVPAGKSLRLAERMMSDVFAHTCTKITDHPAERDLSVWTQFLRLLPGEVVLDPFMGSGTTLRAAMNLGRKAIGIEKSERYCELAVKRLAQTVMDFGGVA